MAGCWKIIHGLAVVPCILTNWPSGQMLVYVVNESNLSYVGQLPADICENQAVVICHQMMGD